MQENKTQYHNDAKIIREMEEHARSRPDQEVCGLIYPDRYVPLRNLRETSTSFFADPKELAFALAHYGEPLGVFHTHPNGALAPSARDIQESYYRNSFMIIGRIVDGELELGMRIEDRGLRIDDGPR